MSKQYYLQDARNFDGETMWWWKKGNRGYTKNINLAQTYTYLEALHQHENRETDIPWDKEYIDFRTVPMVDYNNVNYEQAMICKPEESNSKSPK